MNRNKKWTSLGLGLAALAALFTTPQPAFAADDFGRIVHHIEAQYHVHRQHRFVMGFAGFVIKVHHFAGVKSFKGAIFENQEFLHAGADTKFEETMRAAMDSGWRPMVQSWDRRTGERTYLYAQDLGKDMSVLVVNLEANEAVVLQVKVDPQKLNEFMQQAGAGRHRGEPARPDTQPASEPVVEVAAASPPNWNGVCLLGQEGEQPQW